MNPDPGAAAAARDHRGRLRAAPSVCPLCGGSCNFFQRDRRREYWQCENCHLVQVPPPWHLSAEAEKAEYDKHRNLPDDPGYRRFLARLSEPLLARLPAPSRGLDFGCGPGPALAQMLREAGHQVALYDKFYQPDPSVLQQRYEFITATEVVEHLQRPGTVLEQLWAMLEPGGWLAIMTKRVLDGDAFARWHYKNDPTHIAFFHLDSFEWLARQWQAQLQVTGADTVLLRKSLAGVAGG